MPTTADLVRSSTMPPVAPTTTTTTTTATTAAVPIASPVSSAAADMIEPYLKPNTQMLVSRTCTIAANVISTGLVSRGLMTQTQGNEYALYLAAGFVFLIGNASTLIWNNRYRLWLWVHPAPGQTVDAVAAPAAKIVINHRALAESIAPLVAPLIADILAKRAVDDANVKPSTES